MRVAVTRARDQAAELTRLLRAHGFDPTEIPVIEIVDPIDGGAALRAAARRLLAGEYEWVVLTSVNGAARLLDCAPAPWPSAVAAIGPATAHRLTDAGIAVALTPPQFVAESLVAAFPSGSGRVLLARAAVARDVLPGGLRSKGWTVDVVEAYRTIRPSIDASARELVRSCDAIAFTSPSTVHNFADAFGPAALPPIVACIGPVTAAACRDIGVAVTVEASRHTMDGLVEALAQHRNGFTS